MIKGRCFCGKNRYEVSNEFFEVMYCHCSNCRKLHSSAFAVYGATKVENFHWINSSPTLVEFKSSLAVTRHFCGTCGSLLVSTDNTEPDTIYLSLGTVDEPSNILPEYHQFASSRVSWCKVQDGLPKYGHWPPD